jgi:phosphoserine phosphatase
MAWSPAIETQIDTLIRRSPPGSVATLDMDNTSLRGDIGEALFLKLIVGMQYRGDQDEFWRLFSDQAAALQLRGYWNRFHRSPGVYLRPVEWDPEFVDYVVLFFKQYEKLPSEPDGVRGAYPWVVRLMTGFTIDRMDCLCEEVWKDEMNRPEKQIRLRSVRFGTIDIQGGVRIHRQIAELIARLHTAKWQVWIVTASNEYIARVAAARLGVASDKVIGIRLRRDGDQFTSDIDGVVPYREGKRQAILSRGLSPALAAGDSLTDVDMLRLAPVAIVVDRHRIPSSEMTPRTHWLLQPINTLSPVSIIDPPPNLQVR